MKFHELAINHPDDLLFGTAPRPVRTRGGLHVGGGQVYPELNFTLPPMEVSAATMPEVARHYRQIITGALLRAAELDAPGVVIEFETVPPMTSNPDLGLEIVHLLLAGMEEARSRHGLKSVLRMTPNDNREFARPPVMRSGEHWERMLELFEVQRIGPKRAPPRRHGPDVLHGAVDLRLPPDEPSVGRRANVRADAAPVARRLRRRARSAGVGADPGQRARDRPRDCGCP